MADQRGSTRAGVETEVQTLACGAGAGGTVYVNAGTVTGSGTLRANGGPGNRAGGGGGRVAVLLNGGTNFSDLTITAYGGTSAVGCCGGTSHKGAAGTVYLQKSSDTDNQGELIVDNNDATSSISIDTNLSAAAAVSYTFARLTLRNAGIVGVGSDDTLNITNTAVTPDNTDHNEGIRLNGGTLTTGNAFAFTGYSIHLNAASTFDPRSSVTIGSGARLLADIRHVFSGSLIINANGRLTHEDNSTAETNKIDIGARWSYLRGLNAHLH